MAEGFRIITNILLIIYFRKGKAIQAKASIAG